MQKPQGLSQDACHVRVSHLWPRTHFGFHGWNESESEMGEGTSVFPEEFHFILPFSEPALTMESFVSLCD